MKEFYKIANKVLMIRASNPVVRSIKTGIEGEEEVTEDRVLVEEAIAKYFNQNVQYIIYFYIITIWRHTLTEVGLRGARPDQ